MRTTRRRLIVAPATTAPVPLEILPINVPSTFRAGERSDPWLISARGGKGPKVFDITEGEFPPGMVLQPDGSVPAVNLAQLTDGDYIATVRCIDGDGTEAFATVLISVAYAQLIVSMEAPPSAVEGEDYAQIPGGILFTGGNRTYAVEAVSGALAPGLSLYDDPTSTFRWDIVGTCSGGSGQTYTKRYKVTSGDQEAFFDVVIPVQATTPLAFNIILDALPNFEVGASYSTKVLTVENAVGTITVTRTGQAPAGMTAATNQSGAGPTFPIFGGTATNGAGIPHNGFITASTPTQSMTIPYTLVGDAVVLPTIGISFSSFPAAVPGDPYAETATASGYAGSVIWALGLNDILPPGVVPVISGTDDEVFTFNTAAIDLAAAGKQYQGSLRATDDADPDNTHVVGWVITVGPLATAFVAPFLENALPNVSAEPNVSESNNFAVSGHVNFGSLTAADVTVTIEVATDPVTGLPALLPGQSLSMVDADTFNLSYDSVSGANPAANTPIPYRLDLLFNDPTISVPDDPTEQATRLAYDGTLFGFNFLDVYLGSGTGDAVLTPARRVTTKAQLIASPYGAGHKYTAGEGLYGQGATGPNGAGAVGPYATGTARCELDTSTFAFPTLRLPGRRYDGAQGGDWQAPVNGLSSTTYIPRVYVQARLYFDEPAIASKWDEGGVDHKILMLGSNQMGQVIISSQRNSGAVRMYYDVNHGLSDVPGSQFASPHPWPTNALYHQYNVIDNGDVTLDGTIKTEAECRKWLENFGPIGYGWDDKPATDRGGAGFVYDATKKLYSQRSEAELPGGWPNRWAFKNCPSWRYNQWLTLQLFVEHFPALQMISVEYWLAYDNQPFTKLFSSLENIPSGSLDNHTRFGQLQLLEYATNRIRDTALDRNTWFREIQTSLKPIPGPGMYFPPGNQG